MNSFNKLLTRLTPLFAFLLVIITLHSVAAIEPSFGGCYIDINGEFSPDYDCDKVPQFIDNCPLVPNPGQFDQTGNGLGDACDLVIEDIEPSPPVVLQGRSLITTIRLTNYREYNMRNLRVIVEIPQLGVREHTTLGTLPMLATTEPEIIARIPQCARPGEYPVVVTVEYPYTAGRKEVISQQSKVAVEYGGSCPIEPTAQGKTIVEIIELQDVDSTDGGVYPFTIKNNEQQTKTYTLSLSGIDQWGSAQIEPGSAIVIPAGQTRKGTITVWSNPEIENDQSFVLVVSSNDDIQQTLLTASIAKKPRYWGFLTVGNFVIGLLIILAIMLLVFLIRSGFINTKKTA